MAKAGSKTPSARKRAPGISSRSRSSAKNKAGKPTDSKQESALFRGGSLAGRNASEGHGPGPDAESATGKEITSASPPGTKEAGKAASPSFDEKPVSGKEKDESTARKARGQTVTAGDAPDGVKVGPPQNIDELDPGSSVTKFADEVQIRTPIAGGTIKVFHGRTEKRAFESLARFLSGESELLPGALGTDDEVKAIEAAGAQHDKDAADRAAKDVAARKEDK